MDFLSINNIAFKVLEYPVSYVELIGTLFGLISVYYASRANIFTWPMGIINEAALFLLFYQVQLYADMFLQVYFFVVTIYGWRQWRNRTQDNFVTRLDFKQRIIITGVWLSGTLLMGLFISNVHNLFPHWFPKPAAYPYADSLIMAGSIIATVLLARRKVENWIIWILVDVVCVVLYFIKGINFLAIEYLIFLGLATYGFLQWRKKVTA